MSHKITIVGDPGSTHMGRRDFAERLIDVGKEAGLDCVKFQLFEGEEYTKSGNIEMSLEMFNDLYQYGKTVGIPVTASVFNIKALEFLMSKEVHHIKFGYSVKEIEWAEAALHLGKRVVVTCDPMKNIPNQERLIKLFTATQNGQVSYPNTTLTNFEGLFPERFQGFSDHSLGFLESKKAVDNGAVWIEKHYRLDDEECDKVPDGRFALKPKELKEFVWKVRP